MRVDFPEDNDNSSSTIEGLKVTRYQTARDGIVSIQKYFILALECGSVCMYHLFFFANSPFFFIHVTLKL